MSEELKYITTVLSVAWAGNLTAWAFGPLQDLKRWLNLQHYGLYCSKCVAFWVGVGFEAARFAVTGDFDASVPLVGSLLAAIIERELTEQL